tara:strand:- start:625 stop:1551 length:927 start_codon:yes stop_codon:yes gene_type:complete
MSEAAETAVEASEATADVEVSSEDVSYDNVLPDDLPEFNIYAEEESEDSQVETAEEPQVKEKSESENTWSARVKKDRQLRSREIAHKKREHELATREQKITEVENLRQSLLDDPHAFLKSQGIDPLDFYADWTNRIASGRNEASPKMRLDSTEKELQTLKAELAKRDQQNRTQQEQQEQNQVIQQYYGEIDTFRGSAENYPLTKEQCSTQDIAEGIGAYYRETGIELSFDEAFTKIEDGLKAKEDEIFNNPAIIAKFKKFHGLDASKKMGRRTQTTLSNKLGTPVTKTPPEEMTDDEIHDYWKGKLFT